MIMGSRISVCRSKRKTACVIEKYEVVPEVENQYLAQEEVRRRSLDSEGDARSLTRLYDIGENLSRIGQNKVYSGVRISDGAPIAVKKLLKKKVVAWGELTGKPVPLEICLLDKLKHITGVIKMLDYFEDYDCFNVVMERPDPVADLDCVINQRGLMDEPTARRLFRQIVNVVINIMTAGVVHRCIIAKNILVDQAGFIRLINFGYGAFLKNNVFDTLPGDALYHPPEWIQHKKYHPRSTTVWTLGIILYFMMHATMPFRTSDSILNDKPWLLSNLSPELKILINRCLSKGTLERIKLEQIPRNYWMNIGYDSSCRDEISRHCSRVSFNEYVDVEDMG
ncbi:serine/threonine-protein kinase pim-3-like [Gigantopelta aegis]|uniref:serine/threonine-protein kinase pim-3-like n=1 Tax=Gigantopelta aegis TaxID=1735272 RepID=UPI001B88AABE|nr:serine/threonine-protein kinase pim-3-like [Gigantopelta aegis]